MTKHITNGINHALLESLALSEEIATAPIARDGSGLKMKKNAEMKICLNQINVFFNFLLILKSV